jgi:hypothetical protein
MEPTVPKIRVLNDNLRVTFIGGQLVMTAAVAELPLDVKAQALLAMQRFNRFGPENDPHDEHDFGKFGGGRRDVLFQNRLLQRRYDGRLRRSGGPRADQTCAYP